MSYLSVPGADLYYEVSGSGPVLLLIAGGTDDARDFAGIAPLLEEAFTVVAYDCRGRSRSRLDGTPGDNAIDTHADDADRLMRAVGGQPGFVFGTSGGGQIGLALAARCPGSVRAVVAHEPPAVGLLPPGDPRHRVVPQVCEVYRRDGVGPAMLAFIAGAGLRRVRHPDRHAPESREAAVATQERLVRIERNLDHFFAHVIAPAATYVPDVAALRSGSSRVVVGVGDASEGQMAHDTGLALAERLGSQPATFPGGHAGFVSHPVAFAKKLREVLQRVDEGHALACYPAG
jgi:pimeloyl-ACP methyl ester carboxylesterase